MEHRRVRRVRIGAIGAAGRDDADGRLLRRHGADLHRAGVRAQHHRRAVRAVFRRVERVMLGACRMRFRNVERGEIIPVGLDLRAGGHGEAQIGEDFRQLVHHLRHRMHGTSRSHRRGQAHVDAFPGQLRIERRAFQRILARLNGIGHRAARTLDDRPLRLALFGAHLAQRLQLFADLALLAQRGHADRFQRVQILGRIHLRQIAGLHFIDVSHGVLARSSAHKKKAPNPVGRRFFHIRYGIDQSAGSASLACLTITPKASASFIARSASTLRSSSMPVSFRPCMNCE